MRTVVMVGDLRFDPCLDKVVDIISGDKVIYEAFFDSAIDGRADEDLVVLQYGELSDHALDVIDRAIELGIPVLEYK